MLVVKVVLAKGTETNTRNIQGPIPLTIAAYKGQYAKIRLLVKERLAITMKDYFG